MSNKTKEFFWPDWRKSLITLILVLVRYTIPPISKYLFLPAYFLYLFIVEFILPLSPVELHGKESVIPPAWSFGLIYSKTTLFGELLFIVVIIYAYLLSCLFISLLNKIRGKKNKK